MSGERIGFFIIDGSIVFFLCLEPKVGRYLYYHRGQKRDELHISGLSRIYPTAPFCRQVTVSQLEYSSRTAFERNRTVGHIEQMTEYSIEGVET